MPVSRLFSPGPISTASRPRRPLTPISRRAPLIGAVCVLSLGALSALGYRTWPAHPHRRFPLPRLAVAKMTPKYQEGGIRELPCSQIVVNKTSKACKLWNAGGVLTRAGEASNNPGKYSGTRDLKGRRQPRSVTKFPNQLSTRSFSRMADSAIVPSIVVYVTVPSKELGKKLAESIVKEKLAACVSIVPGIQSIYWWDGKVQTDSEELLIIKTRESLLNSLTEHVKANHEYDVPEVIALPINGGNEKYLEWIKNSTRDK